MFGVLWRGYQRRGREVCFCGGLWRRSCPAEAGGKRRKVVDKGESKEEVMQWLTSSSQPAPQITDRFSFRLSSKSSPISINMNHATTPLTKAECISGAIKLLGPLHTFDNSQSLSSKNLLRKLPRAHPVSVEFSSPNIAKPLHMGHLRSTLTGSFVRNVAEFAGHPNVKGLCFLGDWGRQFGVLHSGVEEEIEAKQVKLEFKDFVTSLDLGKLLEIYVKASGKVETDVEFRTKALSHSCRLEESFEDKNTDSYILWSHTRSVTIQHLLACYNSLHIRFDVFEGESEFRMKTEVTERVLRLLEEKRISEKRDDGTLRVVGLPDGNNVLLKADGSGVYLLRDVAAALRRLEDANDPDRRFVYVVDGGQSAHFKSLFSVLRELGLSRTHEEDTALPFTSTHSHVQFNRVVGMSTRSGNYVLLNDVLTEGTKLMHEKRRESKNARNLEDVKISEGLAVSGLVINSLKGRRTKPYEFDWNEALRSNGNTGVSLQYTVARLRSLFVRVREELGDGNVGVEAYREGEKELERLLHVSEGEKKRGQEELIALIVCLMNFEDHFWRSYATLEPCVLVNYAFQLSDRISLVLASFRILEEPDRDYADAAVWVLRVGENVLVSCLKIVGVKPLEGGF